MGNFKFKKMNKINRLEISILVGIVTAIVLCFFNCFTKSEEISKNVLRLHILANSDSKEDQDLKIKVRDAVLKNFNFNKFNNDIEKSKQEIIKNLPSIIDVVKKTIKQEGFSYDVKANIEDVYFKTRDYENFSMPAGFYSALKIEIGKAQGKNWWCVMVPSMCVPAAKERKKAIETFNADEQDLIKKGNKTEIRFFTVELFKNLFS